MATDFVILVDENDQEIGVMEKLQAHVEGKLHRAFSVFVFNDKQELLMQQRAFSKYHSAGLWTNTCCSHPRPGESVMEAANRRLNEEMGLVCHLEIKTHFIYKTPFENGLTEYEYDYILVGTTSKNPLINLEEVENYDWKNLMDIRKDVLLHPDHYTSWFKIALDKWI